MLELGLVVSSIIPFKPLSFLSVNHIDYELLLQHPPANTSEEHMEFLKDYLGAHTNGVCLIKNMFLKGKRRGMST